MTFARLKRREFISLLGATATWPLAARAQQPAKIARIGFLGATTPSGLERRVERFRAGLRDLGYIEGQNILIDFRWAEGNYARLAEFAAELVRLKVDLLVSHGTPGTLAAKQATRTLPIVMLTSGDAVATGIVANLARPGGNVTGSTFFDPELNAKLLELLKEASPSVKRVGVLVNPDNAVMAMDVRAMEHTAQSLKFELQQFEVRGSNELQSTISNVTRARLDALAVTADAVFTSNAGTIAAIAANNRLPTIGFVEFAQVGGMIGYGANLSSLFYRGAYFVDKILRGAKPADIPVEQPTKFDLVINLKTAKTLGFEIPTSLLARADEVIE
jgi:putative ABC transport system substrate-binding protein